MSSRTVCVTGPIAAGKNAATAILEKNGFASIDADLAGHTAVDNSTERIVAVFGKIASDRNIPLLDQNGKIIRKNLGAILFSDPELLKQHEEIVYPEITSIICRFLEENSGSSTAINATVLYKIPETLRKCSLIIYVDAPAPLRFLRVLNRNHMKFRQIADRMKAQKNLYGLYKSSGIKIIRIWNTTSLHALERKIAKVLEAL